MDRKSFAKPNYPCIAEMYLVECIFANVVKPYSISKLCRAYMYRTQMQAHRGVCSSFLSYITDLW